MAESSAGRAFIGSFTTSGGRGVTIAAVDALTGALTPVGATDTLPDPSFLALSADATVLYAVGESEHGTAAAFDVRGDSPVLLGRPVPVDGAGPTHLALAAGHLVT
ncbi:beta-propeller fold lactonase family protein, partial [Streptomyces sp. YS-3]|uniref:beta-propeller fold lactonase family protein n=1 Tax=Streptomyces sp. YS-3 TaxID=3381352 RepID=UPI0038625242